MKFFIELPTWLGDAVMVTPALLLIIENYPAADITLFGSKVAVETLKLFPNVKNIVIDNTKKGNRILNIRNLTRKLEKFDVAITFRTSLFSKLLIKNINSKIKIGSQNFLSGFFFSHSIKISKNIHQVERYVELIRPLLKEDLKTPDLKLFNSVEKFSKKTVGINPGAAYGSAKRWFPERFGEVALKLSENYDILIFGVDSEIDSCNIIEKVLKEHGVENFKNLCGKTTILELIQKIGGLDLFITNDSGPMHIAAAYKIPTIAIFGPTDFRYTSPWKNENAIIVRDNTLKCSPCMKRVCPLKHHECMSNIRSEKILDIINYDL
ncbi:MAG: lipopolysaccharide heptosyltransferase II [Candidatus Absconditabacterales bacterium]|nr:lipopolysaccharide heptosyltransferase II [Candidatus Absconditabacterales bacterium]